jgi:hypothetical protein
VPKAEKNTESKDRNVVAASQAPSPPSANSVSATDPAPAKPKRKLSKAQLENLQRGRAKAKEARDALGEKKRLAKELVVTRR